MGRRVSATNPISARIDVRLGLRPDTSRPSTAPIHKLTEADHRALRARVLRNIGTPIDPETRRLRELLADQCRVKLAYAAGTSTAAIARAIRLAAASGPLSPRMVQTLELLLQGDSEKQVAQRLELSRHTVHIYVKSLYRKLGVISRGELLAQFISKSV